MREEKKWRVRRGQDREPDLVVIDLKKAAEEKNGDVNGGPDSQGDRGAPGGVGGGGDPKKKAGIPSRTGACRGEIRPVRRAGTS